MANMKVKLTTSSQTFEPAFEDSGNTLFPIVTTDGYIIYDHDTDYETLESKPKINGITLTGNKAFEDLGMSEISNIDIDNLFNDIFR